MNVSVVVDTRAPKLKRALAASVIVAAEADVSSMCLTSRNIESDLNSNMAESATVASIPEISWDDIKCGRLLGEGGFSTVRMVTLKSDPENDTYAIKCRSQSSKVEDCDLANEGRLLASLQHENIIQLHFVSKECFSESSKHAFLILERLRDTLDNRLQKWEKQSQSIGSLVKQFTKDNHVEDKMRERIQTVAIPLAKALEFLHSKNIIFRDVKPANIGFNTIGVVKLFDFGLAKKLKKGRMARERAGTERYMAPETYLAQGYGLPADVYSFALVWWELATLKQPFHDKMEDHERLFIKGDLRPKVDYLIGSRRMQDTIMEAWSRSPELRPTISTILTILNDEMMPHKQTSRNESKGASRRNPRPKVSSFLR
jgi:serine/threonine protein kinase